MRKPTAPITTTEQHLSVGFFKVVIDGRVFFLGAGKLYAVDAGPGKLPSLVYVPEDCALTAVEA